MAKRLAPDVMGAAAQTERYAVPESLCDATRRAQQHLSDRNRPVVAYLCCGTAGGADAFEHEGFRVIGIDIKAHRLCQAETLLLLDIRDVSGSALRECYPKLAGIFATPPCTELSDCWLFNTNAKRRPEPEKGVELIQHCFRIAREAGVPIVLENVRGAQRYIGQARAHARSFYLWGDVPALLPADIPPKGIWNTKSNSYKSNPKRHVRSAAMRAVIPYQLARAISKAFGSPSAAQSGQQTALPDRERSE